MCIRDSRCRRRVSWLSGAHDVGGVRHLGAAGDEPGLGESALRRASRGPGSALRRVPAADRVDARGQLSACQAGDEGGPGDGDAGGMTAVSYTHLRAHETPEHLVCRLLLEKKKKTK